MIVSSPLRVTSQESASRRLLHAQRGGDIFAELARVEDNSLVRALDRGTYALATSAEARPEVGSIPNFHHRLLQLYGTIGFAGTHTNCTQVLRERPGIPATGSFA